MRTNVASDCPEERIRASAFTGGVTEIGQLQAFLEEFIGGGEVERRLKSMRKSLSHAGPVYREAWVKPTNQFWIGLEQLRSAFEHGQPSKLSLEDEAVGTIELGTKLRDLAPGMPETVRREFARRLSAKVPPTPVLFELHVASHFWQSGYEIEWTETATPRADPAPEFAAVGHGCRVEVECKSPPVDWGQLVTRPEFYRLADRIVRRLRSRDLHGEIVIQFPGRIPSDDSWHHQVLQSISDGPPRGLANLSGDTRVEWELQIGNAVIIPTAAFNRRVAELRSAKFGHLAVAARPERGGIRTPILIQVMSRTEDPIADDLLGLLQAASHQFSGTNPATICCLLSEVDDLSAEKVDITLTAITRRYFHEHPSVHLRDVRFFGAPRIVRGPSSLWTEFPTIVYHNPKHKGQSH